MKSQFPKTHTEAVLQLAWSVHGVAPENLDALFLGIYTLVIRCLGVTGTLAVTCKLSTCVMRWILCRPWCRSWWFLKKPQIWNCHQCCWYVLNRGFRSERAPTPYAWSKSARVFSPVGDFDLQNFLIWSYMSFLTFLGHARRTASQSCLSVSSITTSKTVWNFSNHSKTYNRFKNLHPLSCGLFAHTA